MADNKDISEEARKENAGREHAQQAGRAQQDKLKQDQKDSVERQSNLGKPYGSNS